MERNFSSNKNWTYSCKYHIVFCPKYRRKVLTPPIEERLKEIIRHVAEETRTEILELEVMPDPVHILCEIDPQFGVASFVRLVKGRSSRLLRQEFPKLKSRLPTLWTNATFCATVGRRTPCEYQAVYREPEAPLRPCLPSHSNTVSTQHTLKRPL